MARVYEIALGDSFARFTKKLDALNARAEKLGLPPVTATQVGESKLVGSDLVVSIRLEGEAPTIDGWTVVARVEHIHGERNIVQAAPDAALSPEALTPWLTAPANCQHCLTKRRRKDTFVLLDASGDTMQVGGNCLADFLRTPDAADALAAYYSGLAAFDAEFRQYTSGAGEPHVDVALLLTVAQEATTRFGWVPTRGGDPDKKPTAQWVRDAIRWAKAVRSAATGQVPIELQPLVDLWLTGTPSPQAHETVQWVRTTLEAEVVNDVDLGRADSYTANVATLLAKDFAPLRFLNLLVSVPRFVAARKHREAEELAKKGPPKAPSEWFGAVKDREVYDLTLTRIVGPITGEWGDRFGYFFKATGTENIAVWWTGGEPGVEIGENAEFRATISKHDEYQGVKQTILSRVSKVDPVAEEAKRRAAGVRGKRKAKASDSPPVVD
jgi:hypothetical protein